MAAASYDRYINVVEGDFGYKVYFYIADKNKNPLPLSNVVQLLAQVWQEGDKLLTSSGVCSVVDSDLGLCFWEVQDGDFDKDREYYAQVRCSSATKVVTATGQNITVEEFYPGEH